MVAALELDHVAAAGRGARETRSAWNVASLPVQVSSTFSSDGTLATSRSASSTSTRRDADAHQVERAPGGGDGRLDVGVVVAEQRRPERGVVVGEDAARRRR